jgi:hypothetical protein
MKQYARSFVLLPLLLVTLAVTLTPSHAATAVPRCHTGRLYVTVSSSQGAAGTIEVTLRYQSIAPVACSLYGFPGMQLVGARGQDLRTRLTWGHGSHLPYVPKKLILIQPGGAAYSAFMYSDVPTGNENCPAASYLLVTPPNETANTIVPLHGATPCGGRLYSTPVMAAPL